MFVHSLQCTGRKGKHVRLYALGVTHFSLLWKGCSNIVSVFIKHGLRTWVLFLTSFLIVYLSNSA